MSPIKIKIKIPSKKGKVEEIGFSEIGNYLEELRGTGEISEYYGELRNCYGEFIEKLREVERAIEILEEEGEKKFTSTVRKNLGMIGRLEKFDLSSYQEFYTETFHIIDRIVKISPRTQHQVLKYERGRETIELVNSFLGKIQDLKKVLAKRYSEYSVVNSFENAFRKQEELGRLVKNINSKRESMKSLLKEKEDAEMILEKKKEVVEDVKSKLSDEEEKRLEEKIDSLDSEIKTLNSELRSNLLGARRPISGILHSSGSKKVFDFFQGKFVNYPLEYIDEDFWLMVDIIRKESKKLDEKKREDIKQFLYFVEDSLEGKLQEYKRLDKEKGRIEDRLGEISLKNEKILRRAKADKGRAEKKFNIKKRGLENLRGEKEKLEHLLGKKVQSLESILSKISGNKVRIKI